MIIDANKIEYKEKILEAILKMPNKLQDYPKDVLDKWLTSKIGDVLFGVWLTDSGLIACEAVLFPDRVWRTFVSFFTEHKDSQELFKKVEEWSLQRGIHKIIGETKKISTARLFQSKYGIKTTKILLEKEI